MNLISPQLDNPIHVIQRPEKTVPRSVGLMVHLWAIESNDALWRSWFFCQVLWWAQQVFSHYSCRWGSQHWLNRWGKLWWGPSGSIQRQKWGGHHHLDELEPVIIFSSHTLEKSSIHSFTWLFSIGIFCSLLDCYLVAGNAWKHQMELFRAIQEPGICSFLVSVFGVQILVWISSKLSVVQPVRDTNAPSFSGVSVSLSHLRRGKIMEFFWKWH